MKSKLSHTYKVSGRGLFRCGTCKEITPKDDFDQADMKWRSEPSVWKEHMIGRGVEFHKDGSISVKAGHAS